MTRRFKPLGESSGASSTAATIPLGRESTASSLARLDKPSSASVVWLSQGRTHIVPRIVGNSALVQSDPQRCPWCEISRQHRQERALLWRDCRPVREEVCRHLRRPTGEAAPQSVFAFATPRGLTAPFFLLRRTACLLGVNRHEWNPSDVQVHRFGVKHRHKMRKMP